MERSPGCLEAVTLGAWADDRHRKQEENLQWTLWCTVFKTEATIPLASRSNDSWLPTDESFLVQGNYFAQGYATLTAAAHIQWLVNAEAQNLGPVFSIRENSEGPFHPRAPWGSPVAPVLSASHFNFSLWLILLLPLASKHCSLEHSLVHFLHTDISFRVNFSKYQILERGDNIQFWRNWASYVCKTSR